MVTGALAQAGSDRVTRIAPGEGSSQRADSEISRRQQARTFSEDPGDRSPGREEFELADECGAPAS